MRLALGFGWLRAGFAVAAVCLLAGCKDDADGGRMAQKADPKKAALWQEAWRCAASVSSPIDAGRTKIALVEKAVRAGDADYVKALVESDGETWVKGAGLALMAAAAALDQQDASRATLCMQGAQACAAQVNEWREPFLKAELRKGEGALIATSKSDVGAGLALLREWTDGVPAERTAAAAWVCAEWVARRGAKVEDGPAKTMIGAALDYGARIYPWDRLAVLSRLAPQMRAHGMTNEAVAALQQLFSTGGGAASLSTNQFEVALLAARAWNGLGMQREAASLVMSAEKQMRNRETGDALAPGMALIEAKVAMGVGHEGAKQEWLESLRRVGDRPGFYRSIAAALTVGGIAASPCAWTQEDVVRVCALADGAVAGRKE